MGTMVLIYSEKVLSQTRNTQHPCDQHILCNHQNGLMRLKVKSKAQDRQTEAATSPHISLLKGLENTESSCVLPTHGARNLVPILQKRILMPPVFVTSCTSMQGKYRAPCGFN